MLSFEPDNYNWLSLLLVLVAWSGLAALITVAVTIRRSHHLERTVNDCLVALMPGYASFYLTILFAPILKSPTTKQFFGTLLAVQLAVFVIGLLLIGATEETIQKHQQHPCPPIGCKITLTARVRLKVFGWNAVFNLVSFALAAYMALSPWVISPTIEPAAH
jgi:uncharacterized membrane protein YhaH (DUF805 family)